MPRGTHNLLAIPDRSWNTWSLQEPGPLPAAAPGKGLNANNLLGLYSASLKSVQLIPTYSRSADDQSPTLADFHLVWLILFFKGYFLIEEKNSFSCFTNAKAAEPI